MNQPQHLEALSRANEVRLKRVALKRAITSGERTVSEVLQDQPSDWLHNEPCYRLLRAVPGLGPRRIRLTLQLLQIPERKPVGALTERQRLSLAAELERYEERVAA